MFTFSIVTQKQFSWQKSLEVYSQNRGVYCNNMIWKQRDFKNPNIIKHNATTIVLFIASLNLSFLKKYLKWRGAREQSVCFKDMKTSKEADFKMWPTL